MTETDIWKLQQLSNRSEERERKKEEHPLEQLFLELTLRCNEYCVHCGSNCGKEQCPEVSAEEFHKLLVNIRCDFLGKLPFLAFTGGEPLLRKDFLDIANDASQLGYQWGITSNATLIDRQMAKELHRAGMESISVSLDGPREVHDQIRGRKGAYDQTIRGVEALIDEGGFGNIQITTVINHSNISYLDRMFDILSDIDIDSWRIVAMEPIGRALNHPELLLTPEDHRTLLDFIQEKRQEQFPVTYGCCHYLGIRYEREVRDWFFQCQAGRTIAGVMTNGDIGACLNIPRNKQTIQGNIFKDDFIRVWNEKFQIYRRSLADRNETCAKCKHKAFCDGGSYHSWDFERDIQQVCFRGVTFE